MVEYISRHQIYPDGGHTYGTFTDEHFFDVVYVDGDHRAAPALCDMILGWKLLRPGGLMLLDDTNRRWGNGMPLTMDGTLAFLRAIEDRYYYVYQHPVGHPMPKQICLLKRKKRGWL